MDLLCNSPVDDQGEFIITEFADEIGLKNENKMQRVQNVSITWGIQMDRKREKQVDHWPISKTHNHSNDNIKPRSSSFALSMRESFEFWGRGFDSTGSNQRLVCWKVRSRLQRRTGDRLDTHTDTHRERGRNGKIYKSLGEERKRLDYGITFFGQAQRTLTALIIYTERES